MNGKEQIAAVLAHEVKNPVNLIKMNVQYIKDFCPKALENNIIVIEKELEKLNHIISDYTIMAKNTKRENIEMIFIDELLSDIIEEYNLTPYDKKIDFILDSPNDIKLYGDYNKINILFFNIYKNAIEAINNKGIIKTTVIQDIGKTTVKIKDTGGGISPIVLKNLGTPFVTTKENGSGLGILICKNIIHEHKGKINFENTDDGCIVTIELPNYLFNK